MNDFSSDELQAARDALSSSYKKIEKTRETLLQKPSPPKPQLTLAARNLDALRIALALISDELEQSNDERPAADSFAQEKTRRLAAFENVYDELKNDLTTIPLELEKLKAAGKEKTVRYRELLGQKMINNHMIQLFERNGINFLITAS